MNLLINESKPGNEDIDSLLKRYFRSEMPNPWPECEASAQARKTLRPSSRLRAAGRLALAASIVLFFVGYIALAGLFPRSTQGPPAAGSPDIGKSPMKSGPR